MSRNRIPNIWFCYGCQKHHRRSREIAGETRSGFWCDNAIRRGVRDRVNELPFTTYHLQDGNVVDLQGYRCNPR